MYVVRRTWVTLPREARRVATMVADMAAHYEAAGQRSDVRVSFNGGTVPGEKDRVFMEWTEQQLASPYREGNVIPPAALDLAAQVRELSTQTWIEFFELFTPDKAQRDE